MNIGNTPCSNFGAMATLGRLGRAAYAVNFDAIRHLLTRSAFTP